MPRLRAETLPFPKRSGEGKHYGVQARRRDSEAAGSRRRWAFFSNPLESLLRPCDDLILNLTVQFNPEGTVTSDPDDQVPVLLWVGLSIQQSFPIDHVELDVFSLVMIKVCSDKGQEL